MIPVASAMSKRIVLRSSRWLILKNNMLPVCFSDQLLYFIIAVYDKRFCYSLLAGDSANAVPLTKKLRTRVIYIWDDRLGQPVRSAMDRPRQRRTSLMIKVSSVPGKYEFKMYGTGTKLTSIFTIWRCALKYEWGVASFESLNKISPVSNLELEKK